LHGRISRAKACSCSYDQDGFHISFTGNTVPGGFDVDDSVGHLGVRQEL